MRHALLFLVCLIVATQALSGLTKYYSSVFGGGYHPFTARLTGASVVPPVSNNNGGAAVCLLNLNANPAILSCQIAHDLEDVTQISINYGGLGVNAATALIFNGELSPVASSDFILSTDLNPKQIINSLSNGQMSIAVYVAGSQTASIRGQLSVQAPFFAAMDASQVIDDDDVTSIPVPQSTSTALGVALFEFDYVTGGFNSLVYHDVANYYKAGVFIGPYGKSNSRLLVFRYITTASPIQQSDILDQTQSEILLRNGLYINIPSVEFPIGDIRGQIVGGPFYVYTQVALLDDSSLGTNSNSAGLAVFAYNCATRILDYFVVHSVLGVKSIGMYDGSTRVFSLPNPSSASIGTRILSVDQETDLFNGGFSLRVESNTFPYGEISGSITNTTYNYAAILNGRQVTPPVTTSNTGLVLVQYVGNRVINFAALINLSNGRNAITAIEFYQGFPGQNNSTMLWSLPNPSTATLLTKGLRVLNNTQLEALFNNNIYVLVRTVDRPNGELRGQVTRLFGAQCTQFVKESPCAEPSPPPLSA